MTKAETAILFAKPGAVRPADKGALRKVGIIVVEVENLGSTARIAFAEAVSAAIIAKEAQVG